MAKKKRTYRRYTRKAGMNDMIQGIIAGAGANLITKYVNIPMADDLALLGVGYFMKNKTLRTMGAVGLGSDLVSMGLGGQTKNVYGGTY
jgi:hypothetical protein